MMRNKFEFSKVIVRRTLILLVLHLIMTMLVIYFRAEVAQSLVNLMSATMPVYLVIFGGYFGKAGLENYNKIKYDAIETVQFSESTNTTVGSNDG